MIHTQRVLCTAIFLASGVGCSRTPESAPPRESPVADPVPAGVPTRFGGELSVRGPIANMDEGAVFVAVFPIGATGRDREPVLSRTYLLADPSWRRSSGLCALRFDLGAEDALDGKPPRLSREMEFVARFDPDGNPATHEPGEKEVSMRATVGDAGIVIVLDSSSADVPRAAQRDGR